MIRIAVADDHAVVRSGLKQILSEESDFTVTGEARSAEELLDLLSNRAVDVAVVDISMPGRSGLDVLADIARRYPLVRVLVLSMHPEDQFATRALKAGAAGYLTKESAPEELVRAVRKVYSGRKYVSSHLAESLAEKVAGSDLGSLHASLSEREFEVLRYLAEGMTVGMIATRLSLNVKTVSTYKSRLLGKLGMKSIAELTRYAVEQKLIE
ncbi:MAG: response regulator transcription factor [Bacteroidota bacterium]